MIKGDKVRIRASTPEDAITLANIRNNAILSISTIFYGKSSLREWAGPIEKRIQKLLSDITSVRVVAQINGEIVGYGELVKEGNIIGACYVCPKAGGRGVGKGIIAEIERIALENGLRYLQLDASTNAEAFYKSCGFKTTGKSAHKTNNGTMMDGVTMQKELCGGD